MIHDHTMFMNKLESESGRASGQAIDRSAIGQPGSQQTGIQDGRSQQPGSQQPAESQVPGAQVTGQSNVRGPGVDVTAPGAQVRIGRGDGSRNGRGGAAREFLQIQKEVAQQCLQSKTRELSQKEGAQFDRCYMNSQVGAHMKIADELTVYSRHASPSLQRTLQDGLQTTQQHLTMAKQIAERLDGATPRSASNQNPSQQ